MRSRRRLVGLASVATLAAALLGLVPTLGTSLIGDASAPSGGTLVRSPGVVQAGNSKTTCVDISFKNYNLPTSLAPVERATGIHYNCLETFSNADVNWGAWVDPWVTRRGYGFAKWLARDPRDRTVIITQSLVPDQVAATPDWRIQCAAGAFRTYGRQLASRLIARGFQYSVIRLGPEMNGDWYYDSIGPNPSGWSSWAKCFAQTVKAMRSVRGAHFLFDWNVNAGYQDIPLTRYYPGNAYVDIVGIDNYDASGVRSLPPISSPKRWQLLASEKLGLYALERFARAHGKPLSIPEWGTVSTSQGGDDGTYVADMGTFIARHDVAYESWFDPGGDGILTLDANVAPRSLAAYVTAFGPKSAIARYQMRRAPGKTRHGRGSPKSGRVGLG
ncbi:MAG: hypothetical protein JWO62_3115 [Acidimicrobiaceae bacterium]|nr:hypothetical protein [Acidimicrobiaceae bacterium]